ncbi:nucleotide exchange factor GrpE [Streptomyces sp. NRRL F-5755]|uniref:nucleotide exchange factor GrpE n=1 Tax=Streptomyces sp. NRRL F-5755 TaxID=1519475 RepID=UPI000AD5FFE1|nr:nucleotide exchange factor GrpE [Streptomyces sp. NRRL F-5755]
MLTALLPVLDAVDRACEHEPITPGLKDITSTLETQLATLGMREVGEEGEKFDPTRHEAVTHHLDTTARHLTCTKVLRSGYRLGDRLLRPAYVEVTGPPPADGQPGPERTTGGRQPG